MIGPSATSSSAGLPTAARDHRAAGRRRGFPGSPPPADRPWAVTEIAAETGLTPARAALAWVLLGTRTGSRSLNTDGVYGTPSSNRAYPAYEPEASAAIPRTVHSTGVLSRRMATAHGMKRGKAGRR